MLLNSVLLCDWKLSDLTAGTRGKQPDNCMFSYSSVAGVNNLIVR